MARGWTVRRILVGYARAGPGHRRAIVRRICAAVAGTRRGAARFLSSAVALVGFATGRSLALHALLLSPARRFLSADACPGARLGKGAVVPVANFSLAAQFPAFARAALPDD